MIRQIRSVAAVSLALCAGAVACCSPGCSRAAETESPVRKTHPIDPDIDHLILVSLDTLRADFLPIYGHPFVKTPALSRIAAEGIVFENHISCAPTTLASHTSIFTGQYPHHHGTPRNGFLVNEENIMLPEVMKEHGFSTAGFLGSYALGAAFRFDQGFDFFDETFDVARSPRAVVKAERRAEAVTDTAIKWLEANRSDHMFLFVHYFDIHSPYLPPPPFDAMYYDPAWTFTGRDLNMDRLRQEMFAGGPRDRPEVDALKALYAGEISYTDQQVGRLLDALTGKGLLDRSLLVITSDHGDTFTEHRDLFNHGQEIYETTVHTPLLVRFPQGRFGPRRVTELVSNVDLMPTLLEWMGMKTEAEMDGRSFAALVAGGDPGAGDWKREPVFCEATQPRGPKFEADAPWRNRLKPRCVRTDRWKLIHRPLAGSHVPVAPEWELYDLQDDRREKRNLYTGPSSHPDVVKDLRTALSAWEKRADPLPSAPEGSQRTNQALKHLGYAQ